MSLIMNSHDKIKQPPPRITQTQQSNHFSHRHPLQLTHLHHEDVNAVCSGCEHDISGWAYVCTKPNCTFLLHDLCFDLPRHLRHRAHPDHPLILRSSPPYSDGEFTCDACGDSGHGFTYHCGACKFDLHVECASLPEIEIREDHMHPLVLVWGCSDKVEVVCNVCDELMGKGGWIYSCLACNRGAHLECAAS